MAALGARLLRTAYFQWPALTSGALAARDGLKLAGDLARAHGSLTRAGWRGSARCERCGIDARVPGVSLSRRGCCNECLSEPVAARSAARAQHAPAGSWLTRVTEPAVRHALTPRADGGVDAVVALSGGKDSLLALVAARELGLRVTASTLDNGFLLDAVLASAHGWCERLGVPLSIHRESMHDEVRAALRRRRLNPWPCVGCFDRLSRALVAEVLRVGARMIVTGLRYHWPGGSAIAAASAAFAPFAPAADAAQISVLNLPAALALGESEERALLATLGWVDPGLAGHSTNCLLPARFEHLHLARLGRPHDSVRFVAREAREGVIEPQVAVARMAGTPPSAAHQAELERRLAGSGAA